MSRFTIAAAAALISLAAAPAFASPLTIASHGENFAIQYNTDNNIVGGGAVRVIGQGESQRVIHTDASAMQSSAGIPVFVGGSEGGIAYLPADASVRMAAR
jgi:hypothetical protein